MKRTYMVNGRNGSFAVDIHNDQNSGVSGPVITGVTRKIATAVADALNAAYTDGRTDQAVDSRALVGQAYRRGWQNAIAESGDVSRETVTDRDRIAGIMYGADPSEPPYLSRP